MPRARARDKDGLTRQEAEACRLLVSGMTQSDAYRQAFKARESEAKSIHERASRLFAKPQVQTRVRKLLDHANIQDLDSVGRAFADLQVDIKRAKELDNMTAVAQLQRLRLQVLGMLKENVSLTVEQRSDDDSLIKRIAGDDADLAESLRRRLGQEGFDA